MCKWEEPEILGYNLHFLPDTTFQILCKWEEPEIPGYNKMLSAFLSSKDLAV